MRLRRSAAALVLPLALLAGCGEDEASTADDPTPTAAGSDTPSAAPGEKTTAPPAETTAPPAEPLCGEIWVDGQTFPERYKGCLDGERLVQAESTYCEFGTRLFYYANSFYAVPNGPVNETGGALAKDPAFQTALDKCGG